jgi:hypothetical protein
MTEPEDAVGQFLGMRFDHRRAFIESLSEDNRARIATELAYFEHMKRKLGDVKHTRNMLQDLRQSHHEWKLEVRNRGVYFASPPQDKLPLEVKGLSKQSDPLVDHYFSITCPYIHFERSDADARFRTGCDAHDAHVSGIFPNQKIAAKQLLAAGLSPLKREKGNDSVRYFHLPTNNMKWVEVSFRLDSRGFERAQLIEAMNITSKP